MPTIDLSDEEVGEVAFCLRAMRNKKRKEADRDDYRVIERVQAERRVGRIESILRRLKRIVPSDRDLED